METPAILQALELTSWWEMPAVVLAILYLVLAARENIWCWGAAFVSTAIYIYVFFDVNLFLESALQIYYLAMAVYGWFQWRQPTDQSATLPISTWSLKKHVVVIAATGTVVVTSGYLLSENTSAALPYVDAFHHLVCSGDDLYGDEENFGEFGGTGLSSTASRFICTTAGGFT